MNPGPPGVGGRRSPTWKRSCGSTRSVTAVGRPCSSRTALALGLAAAMLAVLLLELALPALPFLGLAMITAHPEARLPPPHERRQAALGITLVLAVAAWVLLAR